MTIIPGLWLNLKVAWWRLRRRFKRRPAEVGWHGVLYGRVLHDGVIVYERERKPRYSNIGWHGVHSAKILNRKLVEAHMIDLVPDR